MSLLSFGSLSRSLKAPMLRASRTDHPALEQASVNVREERSQQSLIGHPRPRQLCLSTQESAWGPPAAISLQGQTYHAPTEWVPVSITRQYRERLSAFPRKYFQQGLIFTVLKLTLANVIARCTDLSNLFSAAILKHIIIVYCVSKAGLGFHVTKL